MDCSTKLSIKHKQKGYFLKAVFRKRSIRGLQLWKFESKIKYQIRKVENRDDEWSLPWNNNSGWMTPPDNQQIQHIPALPPLTIEELNWYRGIYISYPNRFKNKRLD